MSRPPSKRLPSSLGLMAPKERQHHNGGVVTETINELSDGKRYIKRQRCTAECVIDNYHVRGKLTDKEFEAAMKFRKAYLRFVLRVRVEDGAGSHGDDGMAGLMPLVSERILKEAYGVLSQAQKVLVIDVCGNDEWAKDTYKFQTFQRGLAELMKLWNLA